VVATAPSRHPFAREVDVRQPGALVEVEIAELPVFDPHREPVSSAPPDGAPAPLPSGAALRPRDVERPGPTPYGARPDPLHRSLMWVTGGLTLAGIAVGSTFGGLALSAWADVEDAARERCRNPARYQGCAQPVPALARRAMSYATVSDFSFIAAGAALAGTAVLWFTLPPDGPRPGARVELVPGLVGGSVLGVF
jgi:hypothetical protein